MFFNNNLKEKNKFNQIQTLDLVYLYSRITLFVFQHKHQDKLVLIYANTRLFICL